MQITRQADYAVRAVLYLARRLAQATFGQLARQALHASKPLAAGTAL